ncbi:MAG: histidine ammonia-lyase [Bacteroidales bacterium]|nr:histidine ammonia-lyase [Bacteroidales bacterium]HOY40055.1 histidine ammonia-lyase [Bacteroidales bacterium]HQP03369.1 histidine ammonia-lyase [Bacteroidales bacterium]
MYVHIIKPESLRLSDLERILQKPTKLELSEESIHLIQKCRTFLDRKLSNSDEPVYGINTGFGALCNISVSKESLAVLQKNLVQSHACGAGTMVEPDIVKIMMVLKIHALSLGKSGIQLATVQKLIELFNHEIFPVVYELGSLGASGDLAPLAHMVLPLLGSGKAHYKGRIYNTENLFTELNISPIELGSKEGLALLNGTQFMSAHGVVALILAGKLSRIADSVAALSLDAYNGRPDPFDELLQQVRPHAGQIETARNIRKILKGSQLIGQKKMHVQDPYSFRCIPQVHGAVKDVISHVAGIVATEINSVTDNPTIFPDDNRIMSGGNFHGEPLAMAYDYMAIALSELGSISERRLYRLISGQRGLPEFLVSNPGLNSGFMIPQYTAASVVSQNKQLCTPASVDSISSSNEQEDHVSMGANAATKLLKVCNNLKILLSIEFFAAAQAIEFRRPAQTSPVLEAVLNEYRKQVHFVENDCLMHDEIQKTIDFLLNI